MSVLWLTCYGLAYQTVTKLNNCCETPNMISPHVVSLSRDPRVVRRGGRSATTSAVRTRSLSPDPRVLCINLYVQIADMAG